MASLKNEVEVFSQTLNPKKYTVILANDDYTTMEFVIFVLMNVFYKTYDEAYDITMSVHDSGKGVCGVYVLDVAMTKTNEVIALAKENDFPLKAFYEEV